jgi:hypothetical protein
MTFDEACDEPWIRVGEAFGGAVAHGCLARPSSIEGRPTYRTNSPPPMPTISSAFCNVAASSRATLGPCRNSLAWRRLWTRSTTCVPPMPG